MTAMINQEVFQMERFTAKPKWWGKLRHKSKLKASEFLVLDVIYDKTIDWGKTTDRISISQFESELGLSNRGVLDSLRALCDKQVIFIEGEQRKINIISINIEQCKLLANSATGENFSKTGEKSSQDEALKTGENFSKTGEVFSQSGENFSKTGEKSSYTRNHYTIPIHDTITQNQKVNSVKPKTKKSKSNATEFNPIDFKIPEYVNSDLWKSYHEMREKQGSKKIATEKACEIILKDFEKWHEAGLDVNKSLENSIKSNWIGVFEPKPQSNQPVNQSQTIPGQAHANYQPNHSQDYDTSTTYGYASKLTADANAYYAQRRAERANDRSSAIDVHSMESPL